jgi:YegS/Rv2252/BmrU family lipid kinase
VTERPGHAHDLAQALRRQGVSRVIAWGGDGTVNEVASALVGSDAIVGIVPGGSGNGLARELGIPFDPARALGVALDGPPRRIDAGELDGRLFFNIAGVGLDARIARRFSADSRRGFTRYLQLSVAELVRFSPLECTVTVDGVPRSVRPLIVALANSRQYGSGAVIAPRARVDDGKLDVVLVPYRAPWKALMDARHLFTATVDRVAGVSIARATEVEISSLESLEYHVDGEAHVGSGLLRARVHRAVLCVASAAEPNLHNVYTEHAPTAI